MVPLLRRITTSSYRVIFISILCIIAFSGLGTLYETHASGPIPFVEAFNNFTGQGFSLDPALGQLDSGTWIATGFDGGTLEFDGTQQTGDFARGASTGGVRTGGIYAFDVGDGNMILGMQPTGSDFTPGEIILRLQNNTGATITQLDISYNIWHFNDQGRSNSLNFSYSADNITYSSVGELDFSTSEGAAVDPVWQSVSRSTTLTGLSIVDRDFFYLRWVGDDVGGSGSRDEYGIDNIAVVASATETPTALPTNTPIPTATPSPTPSHTPTAPPTNTSIPTATPSSTPSPTPVPTETPTPSRIPTATGTSLPINPGAVVINEIVTDPQQDWSSNGFNGVAGSGPVTPGTDEFVELYINTTGLDLTGWTIELQDTTPVSGDLTGSGAFQTSRYIGGGNFTNTAAGDYLLLGNVAGSGAMNNNILVVLRDHTGTIIDKVEFGSDPEGDGSADGAPNGNATDSTNEAVFRYPNGADSDTDTLDFIAGVVTLGNSNNSGATPTPTNTATPYPTSTRTATSTNTPETPTATPESTLTPLPSDTPTATVVLIITPTGTPTEMATSSPTPALTATPLPTDTPSPTATALPVDPGSVIINEVAWSGTQAGYTDEWLELFNTTPFTVNLNTWVLTSINGLNIRLDGTTIGPFDYYLIERGDDTPVSDIPADLVAGFGRGLNNNGDSLFLWAGRTLIDTANLDGGPWPSGSTAPGNFTMERIHATQPDNDTNWASNNGFNRNGLDLQGSPINGSPKQANSTTASPTPAPTASPTPVSTASPTLVPTASPTLVPTAFPPVFISEFLYDGETASTEGDEFVELCNPNDFPVNLAGYKVGDEETAGGGESMLQLPQNITLDSGACLVIAKNAADFQNRFGTLPDFAVSELSKYTAWGSGSWSLANTGDELLLLGPNNEIFDSVAFRNGDYTLLELEGGATAPYPHSLQRVWPTDTNSMPQDFVRADPNPGIATMPLSPPASVPPPAVLPGGMNAYWGELHAHTTYSDGAGPPHYALSMARSAGLHFYSITDHGWWLSEVEWRKTLSQTEAATVPGQFVALRGVEWSHDIAGHINVFNNNTLLSRTHPLFSTLPNLYTWLAANPNVVAQFNHPDPSYDGTFSDFALHPAAAQVMYLQEIGNNAQQYTTYEPSFLQSNAVGWRVAPTINGDTHTAKWGIDMPARTGIVAPALTKTDLLDAMRTRRVFATEDSNLALAMQANDAWMGSVIDTAGPLSITVTVVDPDPEPITLYLYDRNLLLASVSLPDSTESWQTTVDALPGHYFWVKAVQDDGDRAYSAPVWVGGQASPDTLYLSEILPSPYDKDWDGDGVADHNDEWIELFNPMDRPVGLGGWRLVDASGVMYDFPLDTAIAAGEFKTVYGKQTNIGLNNGGDTLTLLHPNGAVIDTVNYEYSPGYDETWCRLPEAGGEWNDNCAPSPGEANWEIPPAEPLRDNIYNVKRLSYNAWVQVKGWVTTPPGVLGTRAMYIQDETSGILVYLPKDHRLSFNLGDEIKVEGNLRSFHNEFEIVVDDRSDVDFKKSGVPPPPLPIKTTSLLEPYEGMLVQLTGQTVRFKGRSTLWVDDGTDPAKVYIRRSTGIKKPFIEVGKPITVVGVVSQYSELDEPSRNDYRLLLRYQTDLTIPNAETLPAVPDNWPMLLPETGY